ncbi:MAG: archease [Gemmatimonadetes bacterium]|nr:archease [Gemmatimonadota bacterium]
MYSFASTPRFPSGWKDISSTALAPSHRFLEHTGELALLIRAGSFEELLEEAGRALAGLQLPAAHGPPETDWEEIAVRSADRDALLVDWLNELIFRAERDRWIAVEFEIRHASATHLIALARGVRVSDAPALVKAATLHELRVDAVPGGMEAHVILDI